MYLSWRQSLRNSQKYFRVFSRKLMTWHLRFIHLSNSVLFIYCFLLCSKESFVFLTLNQFDVTMSSIHTLCVCVWERERVREREFIAHVALDIMLSFLEILLICCSLELLFTHTHTHTHTLLLHCWKDVLLRILACSPLENTKLILKFPPLNKLFFWILIFI
jgi:hypothetical protein